MTLIFLILTALALYYFFIYEGPNGTSFYSSKRKNCPNCKNPVESSFNVCPVCRETLKKRCPSCGELTDAAWKYCPFCEAILRKGD